jgi:hypothetical protein
MDRLDQLFELLDRWRHLPAYQLERRADILFAIYLPAFLSHYLKIDIRPELIPEFPVRLGSIYPDLPVKNQNHSCKVDYVAFAQDGSKIWFVELKTDSLSRRDRQDEYLLLAQKVGMPTLIDGICKLFLKTTAKNKYYCLLVSLESLGQLKLPTAFHEGPRTGWRGAALDIATVSILPQPQIEILYLQPIRVETGDIGFEAFADWLTQFPDPLSQKFGENLRRWAKLPAGIRG